MGDGSVSKEISDILARLAGHEGRCEESKAAILQGLRNCQSGISELKSSLKSVEANLEAKIKAGDSELEGRVGVTEDAVHGINLKLAYFMGAAAMGSFLGGALMQLIKG